MINTLTPGLFITLEGIEGVGKSTQVKFIQEYLQQAQHSVIVTREPGGTPLAEELRQLLLKQQDEAVTPTAELLILFAGRAQHIAHVIRPALAAGQWVICDRFTDATYAYQGGGRNMSHEQIVALEQWVQADLRPDCTLLLDAPLQLALKRTKRRGELDRIEKEQEDFFERVRNVYLARAEQFPDRYKVINTAAPLLKVQKQIKTILDSLLQQKI